jgi:hypothetical protein
MIAQKGLNMTVDDPRLKRLRTVRAVERDGECVWLKRCVRCSIEKVVTDDAMTSGFYPCRRYPDGSVQWWQSYCKSCCYRKKPTSRRSDIEAIEIFRDWLREAIDRHGGMRALVQVIGNIHEDQIRRYLRGYYWQRGKKYPVRGVTIAVIDRVLTAEGSTTLNDLYPLN